jgi:tRNA (guanine37-N1)-methyltransferase
MIYFDIITIFPKIFDSFLKESLIKKAQEKGLIKIRIYNLRDFTKDKHKTVDDKPYGGGLGMVLKLEPIYRALQAIKRKNPKTKKQKVILFTPRGKQFTQRLAYKLSKLDRIIMVCGRYEGIDERVVKYLADLKLSIGPYDLMGGEVPAMVVIETISRLIPGVIGKKEFLKERLKKGGFIEYPQYTRPEVFSPKKGVYWKVPKVLLSGHHRKIEEWRKKHQKIIEK